MISRLSAAVAASLLAGAALAGPAVAQTPGYEGVSSAGASDDTVVMGQTFTLTTGDRECPPGGSADVAIRGNNFSDDKITTTGPDGAATISYRVPDSARPGRASATFTCASNTVVVPFTVVSSAAASPGRGQLPRTGGENLVPLAVAGAAMVAVGAVTVVAVRRRRDESMPAGLA